MNTLEYTEHVLEVLKTAPLSIEEQAKLLIAISSLISKWDDGSWYARQAGTSRHIALTAKGLRAFYKAMF